MKDQSEAETLKLVFPTTRLFSIPPRLPPHTHIHNLALHDRKTGFCVQASASSPRKRVQLLRKSAFVCVCVLVKKKKKKTACGHSGLSEECFEKSGGKVFLSPSPPLSQILQSVFLWSADKKNPQPAELCLSACAGGRKKQLLAVEKGGSHRGRINSCRKPRVARHSARDRRYSR